METLTLDMVGRFFNQNAKRLKNAVICIINILSDIFDKIITWNELG